MRAVEAMTYRLHPTQGWQYKSNFTHEWFDSSFNDFGWSVEEATAEILLHQWTIVPFSPEAPADA